MITTHDIKRDRFKVFRVGNPSSTETILVMGSCRVIPYLNYLEIWNRTVGGNRFLIYGIDPYDFNWDDAGNRVDLESTIAKLETDQNLLTILGTTKIFIHEYFSHFGIFNVDRQLPKHVYQFGMKPEIDVTIPNFHDVFILFNDFAKFPPFKDEAAAVRGALTPEMEQRLVGQANANIQRFCDVCSKTDLPQMRDFFMENWLKTRLFWTFNHITRHFSFALWRFLNEEFLQLPETDSFRAEIEPLEFVGDPRTPLSQYDTKHFGYAWGESVVDFAKHNKFR